MQELMLINYTDSYQAEWDSFIDQSRNGSFILKRMYLEYHKDRFPEASYILQKDRKVIAIIPGTIHDGYYSSHGGLTYGGWIFGNDICAREMLLAFNLLNKALLYQDVHKVIYKPVPAIYHIYPAEEDLYSLFRNHASLSERRISSVIYEGKKLPFSHSRKDGIRKAKKNGIIIRSSTNYSEFWNILIENLYTNYSTKPVHSLEEIKYLSGIFPNNIFLHCAFTSSGDIIAGVVIYAYRHVAHVQYISANALGKALGALDLLFDELINTTYSNYQIFDFGTSCEDGGKILNEGLIYQKEGFGGRGICYDTYEYDLR